MVFKNIIKKKDRSNDDKSVTHKFSFFSLVFPLGCIEDIVNFLKTININSSTVPISNVKLKIVLKIYHMLYGNCAGEDTTSKYQRIE